MIVLPDHMGIIVYLQLMWSMWVVLLPFATLTIYGFEFHIYACLYQYACMYFAKLRVRFVILLTTFLLDNLLI